jgi:HlyD family secretion protein
MKRICAVVILPLLILVTACSSQNSTSAATPNPTPTAIAPGVKGKVTPHQFVELSMNSSGVVTEVLVSEGDQVKAGQALVRLEDARLKLAVEEARLRLKRAELDLGQAQKPADPADLAAAEKAIQAAQATLDNTSGSRSTEIGQAQSRLRSAELALEKAQRDHNKLLDYKSWGYDVEDGLRASQVNLDNLRTELEIARHEAASAGNRATQSSVEAQHTLASAQAKYNALKKQPELEAVKAAQLAVESAQVALARAEANLKNVTLAAPIAGAVAEVKIKAGQPVPLGALLITLADTGTWVVETDNLTELAVVSVKEGDQVTVKFDAIPGFSLPGRIERIAVRSQDKRGEVTYTVRVVLSQSDPRLRWGMTSLVIFEK